MRRLARVADLAPVVALSGPVMARQAGVPEIRALRVWARDSYAAALRVVLSACRLMEGQMPCAMNRFAMALRSFAVDPRPVPRSAPTGTEKDGREALRRLMVVQDIHGARTGAQQADFVFRRSAWAEQRARRICDSRRMIVLLPIQRAHASLPRAVLDAPPADPS